MRGFFKHYPPLFHPASRAPSDIFYLFHSKSYGRSISSPLRQMLLQPFILISICAPCSFRHCPSFHPVSYVPPDVPHCYFIASVVLWDIFLHFSYTSNCNVPEVILVLISYSLICSFRHNALCFDCVHFLHTYSLISFSVKCSFLYHIFPNKSFPNLINASHDS